MDDGTLEQTDHGWKLRFERHLPHPPHKVWRALTDPDEMRAWFPADMEGERRVGAHLRFPFREEEGDTMDGEMLVYDPPHGAGVPMGRRDAAVRAAPDRRRVHADLHVDAGRRRDRSP
jgi:hypothetical protein